MKNAFEYRGLPLKLALKDVDEKTGTVTGYASAFDSKDSDEDVIRPGAFAKTIAERGPGGRNIIKHLYQHRSEYLLAKPSVLKEDDFGLYFESTISKTTWGKDVLILYSDGVIDQHSIGFATVTERRDQESRTRELLEVKLYEFSSVSFAANENTPFLGMKSADDVEALFKRMDSLNRALRKHLSDETAEGLEMELKQIQQAIIDLKQTLVAPPPGGTHRPDDEIVAALRKNLEIMRGRKG